MLYRLTVFAQWLAGVTPQRVRWFLGGLATQVVYWVWTEKRLNTLHNMSVVLNRPITDPLVQRTARLSWRNYGHYVSDLFDIPNHDGAYYLDRLQDTTPLPPDAEGKLGAWQLIDEAIARKHGVLLTTGHYGNYDVAGTLIASHVPIYALAELLPDPRMNELLQSQRRKFGITIVSIEDSMLPVIRHFRAGGVLASPIDRPVPPEEGIPVQFFGRTTYVPKGLGAMVAKWGVAICPGVAYYAPNGTYRIRVFPAVTIEKSGDEEADVSRATQAMFDALEAMIRDDPTQWYMFRRVWPETVAAPDHAATHSAAFPLAEVGQDE
jgi:KDO2-lipid IV(A) lauroyltransferase